MSHAQRMPLRDVVVMGASAGGLEALKAVLKPLPRSFQACILIVIHGSTDHGSVLPEILERFGALPAAFADDGDALTPGRIFVARPDMHLLIRDGRLTLGLGLRENGFRPAIDPLFRTAARELGPRVIGVILSGALSDGTYGLGAIKRRGGVAFVQDPQDALVGGMPLSAMSAVVVDEVLPAADLAAAIRLAVEEGATPSVSPSLSKPAESEIQFPEVFEDIATVTAKLGAPSALTCPDCGGALWQVQDDGILRFRCHVGHQYAPEHLDEEQRDATDSALWTAIRVLEERAELRTRMATRARQQGLELVAATYDAGALDAREQAEQVRNVVIRTERPRRLGHSTLGEGTRVTRDT